MPHKFYDEHLWKKTIVEELNSGRNERIIHVYKIMKIINTDTWIRNRLEKFFRKTKSIIISYLNYKSLINENKETKSYLQGRKILRL